MNTRSLRTSLAAALGGAVVVAGLLVGASFALAQDSGADATDDPAVVDDESVDSSCDRLRDKAHRWFTDIDELAAEFGLTLDELMEQLRDGATLEEIAAEAGVDLDAVVAELKEKALAEIDEVVAAGDMTEEQAERLKERIEAFELGDGPLFGVREFGFHGDPGFRPHGVFGDLLEDVDLDKLREQLQSGASLNEALESLGVDVDQLLEEALESATARLDELVEDGRLTEERADEIKERLESMDLTEGLPFGLRDFRFREFDGDGFEFNFEFRGPRGRGHGFGFFGGGIDGEDVGASNAEGALLDA